jgi:hypothetical protein
MNQLESIVYFMSIEIGPCTFGEVHLGAHYLPQEEIGNTGFARGSDNNIYRRKFW